MCVEQLFKEWNNDSDLKVFSLLFEKKNYVLKFLIDNLSYLATLQ